MGEQARKVYEDAQAMLKKIIEGRWLQANGVMGLFLPTVWVMTSCSTPTSRAPRC